jgi:hypothetical protein
MSPPLTAATSNLSPQSGVRTRSGRRTILLWRPFPGPTASDLSLAGFESCCIQIMHLVPCLYLYVLLLKTLGAWLRACRCAAADLLFASACACDLSMGPCACHFTLGNIAHAVVLCQFPADLPLRSMRTSTPFCIELVFMAVLQCFSSCLCTLAYLTSICWPPSCHLRFALTQHPVNLLRVRRSQTCAECLIATTLLAVCTFP